MIHLGKTLRVDSLAHAPAKIRQLIHIRQCEFMRVLLNEKKPVPAPRDIASHRPDPGHAYGDAFVGAPAWDVGDRNFAVRMQGRRDDADRRIDAMFARLDPAQMRERNDQPNRSVATHAEITHVVKKDDSRGAGFIIRLHQQCAHDHIRSTRFVDDRRAETVVFKTKRVAPRRERAASEIRPALNNDARRLSARVRVDKSDLFNRGFSHSQYIHLLRAHPKPRYSPAHPTWRARGATRPAKMGPSARLSCPRPPRASCPIPQRALGFRHNETACMTPTKPAVELFSQLAEPFTGEALFDRLTDLVFFIKNRRAEYVVVNQ